MQKEESNKERKYNCSKVNNMKDKTVETVKTVRN